MPGRQIDPRNLLLADQISALLADVWPEALTSSEIAERVGGTRTMWQECYSPRSCRVRGEHPMGPEWNAQHVDGAPGQVDQDSWDIPIQTSHVNPVLNRLARQDLVAKTVEVHHQTRRIVWSWIGDRERELDASDLLTPAQAAPDPAVAARAELAEQRRQIDAERREIERDRIAVDRERAEVAAERERLRADLERQRHVTRALLASSEHRGKAAEHESKAMRHLLDALHHGLDLDRVR